MRISNVMIVVCLLLAACDGSKEVPPQRTQRESDSIIGQSQLPGASGVQKALAEQDSARARAARIDSLATE